MALNWSEEFDFAATAIKRAAPQGPGIYQIFQSVEYARYLGKTRVLEIGMSESDLRQELLNHLDRHTVSNRLARIRNRKELSVTFRFAVATSDEAASAEKQLLRDFEDEYWDLPVLNSQRGYKRTEDRHFRDP